MWHMSVILPVSSAAVGVPPASHSPKENLFRQNIVVQWQEGLPPHPHPPDPRNPAFFCHLQQVRQVFLQTLRHLPKGVRQQTFCSHQYHQNCPFISAKEWTPLFIGCASRRGPSSVVRCCFFRLWVPSWGFPKLGLRQSYRIEQLSRASQLLHCCMNVPWPIAGRDTVIHAHGCDQLQDGIITVWTRTLRRDCAHSDTPYIDDAAHSVCDDGNGVRGPADV